jgi:VanZ family protein
VIRRRFAIALAGLIGLIVYGSLYPFDFAAIEFPGGAFHALLSTWPERTTTSDLLANVLLYIPFGFAAVLCWNGPRPLRALAAILAGIALSLSLEYLQLFDMGRWATMSDVRSNAAGAILGTAAGLIFERFWKPVPGGPLRLRPYPLLLSLCWAGYRFFPYAPVIDLHKYWRAVRLLFQLEFSAASFFDQLAVWLAVGLIVEEITSGYFRRIAFPLLIAGTLAARILIDTIVLWPPEVAAAGAAALLWACGLFRWKGRESLMLALFVIALLIEALRPPLHETHQFHWLPFYGLLMDEPQTAIPWFFAGIFRMGTLLFLLNRAGMRWTSSLVAGATVIGAATAARYYVGRGDAEVTALVMFASMAMVWRLAGETPRLTKLTPPDGRAPVRPGEY